MLRQLEGNRSGATTLAVLDTRTRRGAGGGVLALAAIRHGVDEVDVGLFRDLNIEAGDREGLVSTAGDAWSAGAFAQGTLDAFALFTD